MWWKEQSHSESPIVKIDSSMNTRQRDRRRIREEEGEGSVHDFVVATGSWHVNGVFVGWRAHKHRWWVPAETPLWPSNLPWPLTRREKVQQRHLVTETRDASSVVHPSLSSTFFLNDWTLFVTDLRPSLFVNWEGSETSGPDQLVSGCWRINSLNQLFWSLRLVLRTKPTHIYKPARDLISCAKH